MAASRLHSFLISTAGIPPDADAYRSLLSHLDRPSTGQSTPASQQGLGGASPSASPPLPPRLPPQQQQQQLSVEQGSEEGPCLTVRQLQAPQQAAGGAAAGGGEEEEVCSHLFHQVSISRVSSLGESMLQEAAALCLADAGEQQAQQAQQQQLQPPPLSSPHAASADAAEATAAAAIAAAAAAAAAAARWQVPGAAQQPQQRQRLGEPAPLPLGEVEAEPEEFTPQRPSQQLPALRLSGAHHTGRSTAADSAGESLPAGWLAGASAAAGAAAASAWVPDYGAQSLNGGLAY